MKGIAVLLIAFFALSTILMGAAWAKENQPASSPIALPIIGKFFAPNTDLHPVEVYKLDIPVPVYDGIPVQPGTIGTSTLPGATVPDDWPEVPYRYDTPEQVVD